MFVGCFQELTSILPSVLYNREPLSQLEQKEIVFDTVGDAPEIGEVQATSDPMEMAEMLEQASVGLKVLPEWVGIAIRIFLWVLVLSTLCVFLVEIIRSIKNAILDFNVDDEDEIVFLDSEETDDTSNSEDYE